MTATLSPSGVELTRELGQSLRPAWAPMLDRLAASGAPVNALGIGGASFLRNLPAQGAYAVNEALFNAETERNDVALQPVAFTGLGGAPMDIKIPNNGILTNVRLTFIGTVTPTLGTGAVTSGYQFPHNAPWKFVTLNANGQTSLISAEGNDLRMRRQRIWRNPKDDITVSPGIVAGSADPNPGALAGGAQAITLTVDVPIVHDDTTLIGALFAQSDQNNLSIRVTPAAVADLAALTGTATLTLTGTLYATATFYDIPILPVNGHDQVVVPNLAWLHGYLSGDYNYANTGNVRAPFIRTAGQLLAYGFYIDNGGLAQLDPGGAAITEVRFGYGGNRKPRVLNPPIVGLEKQGRDYNGRLRPGWWVWDFEIDNPARDLVYPKGVTELAVEVNILAGTTINPNARIHYVEDTLFTGR